MNNLKLIGKIVALYILTIICVAVLVYSLLIKIKGIPSYKRSYVYYEYHGIKYHEFINILGIVLPLIIGTFTCMGAAIYTSDLIHDIKNKPKQL